MELHPAASPTKSRDGQAGLRSMQIHLQYESAFSNGIKKNKKK